jgi:hypothetical protein
MNEIMYVAFARWATARAENVEGFKEGVYRHEVMTNSPNLW